MANYVLEDEAENDLLEIGRYTTRTWDVDQAVRYLSRFDDHFESLARNDAQEKAVRQEDGDVLILAVLHENMDLIARFRERLDSSGLSS